MPLAPLTRAARRGLLCTFALASLCAAAPAGERPDSAFAGDPVLERVRRGVVTVVTYGDSGRPLLRGSGFFVSRGRVVTSLHVLRGARSARVHTHDGKTHAVSRLAAASDERDLALLEVSLPAADSGPDPYTLLEVEPRPPRDGDEITILVKDAGSHEAITNPRLARGTSRGLWFVPGAGELLRVTARIDAGNSGGPVLDRAGRVVGVAALYASAPDDRDLNFAVTSDAIHLLISQSTNPAIN